MSTAIKLDNAKNVHLKGIRTSGFENGITANNSTGIIEDYSGDPISLRNETIFQILNSRTRGLEVSNSKVGLYNTLAKEVIKITEGKEDPELITLQYYANQVINSRTKKDKIKWWKRFKNKAIKIEPYLKLIGYVFTAKKLVEIAHSSI